MADSLADRLALDLAADLRDARARRGWTLREVARHARLTDASVQRLEAGARGSIGSYARLAVALGLVPSFTLASRVAPGARWAVPSAQGVDAVHAAMGEAQAAHLRERGWEVLLDEPYQHYQFAGRADIIALDRARRAMLHIENRTRFPDIQAFAGSYNAKRAYLGPDLAARLGIRGGFGSVAHVVAALWSSEVLHVVRLRQESFAALCPQAADAFAAWWDGTVPVPGASSSFVLFDPIPGRRRSRRRWVGLDDVRQVEPRYRGYADAVRQLRLAGHV
jgi:transcriptional regulator with XRE-family HTH domain